jgi:hypothetical protein
MGLSRVLSAISPFVSVVVTSDLTQALNAVNDFLGTQQIASFWAVSIALAMATGVTRRR